MRFFILVLLLLMFLTWNGFSQVDIRNDWAQEKLKHNPSKVTESEFVFVEKFGDLIEQKISWNTLTFNPSGYYLAKHFNVSGNEHESQKDVYHIFSYESGTNNLTKLESEFPNGRQTQLFEYSSGLRTKRSIEGGININFNKVYVQEYKYDNQNRNILATDFDSGNQAIAIAEYIYSGKYLSEENNYNSNGMLVGSNKYKYDTKGNLTKSEKYIKKNLKESISYTYNEKNDVVREQTITINPYNGVSDQPKDYYWYKYDYLTNGLVKKSFKYRHCDLLRNGVFGDKPEEFWEYKYDEFGNWVEKIMTENNVDRRKFMPSHKYVREIIY